MYRDPGSIEPNENEWFAFRVRPRHEKQVSLALREKGFVEFLPLYKSKRQWADRTKVVEMPLFPGYIFCSTVRSSIVPVLMTSGVIDVVRAGTNPLPADKAEIEALQQTVSVDVPLEAWPYTEVGEVGFVFHLARPPGRLDRDLGRGSALTTSDPLGKPFAPIGSWLKYILIGSHRMLPQLRSG